MHKIVAVYPAIFTYNFQTFHSMQVLEIASSISVCDTEIWFWQKINHANIVCYLFKNHPLWFLRNCQKVIFFFLRQTTHALVWDPP